MVTVSRIRIYPIKSLDGMDVVAAEVLPNGALTHDRQFAMVDGEGNLINGKRNARVHRIRCTFDPNVERIALRHEDDAHAVEFSLHHERDRLAIWLSDALQVPLRLVENCAGGFPDDTESPGLTLVSRPSLARAGTWFEALDEQQLRGRMRANVEVDGCEPFWEDRLAAKSEVAFRIGDVEFAGTTVCARCVVPSRCPRTGEKIAHFSSVFMIRRQSELPPWADRKRFDHYYRMAINTRGSASGVIRVGDPLSILDRRTGF